MSDQRSAIAEFRELEQRRLAGGLTSAEVARYDWLRRVVGNQAPPVPGAGFDMGTAAGELRDSLLPAGLRDRSMAPTAPPPASPDGHFWADLPGQPAPAGAPPESPFPEGGLDASWLAAEEPLAAPPAVMPQAWNPAAPGYDPNAPYDEAAWIAAGYDPNIVYDWSAYGADAAQGSEALPPGLVVTAPAIPLPGFAAPTRPMAGPAPAPEPQPEPQPEPAEEDLPTLDVLSPEELPAAEPPGPARGDLAALEAFPITDALLAPAQAPIPPAVTPPPALASLADDDGWPGFEPDAAPLEVAPAFDQVAPEPSLELLEAPEPLAAEIEAAPAPTEAAAPEAPAPVPAFDDLLSDDELELLASGGGMLQAATPEPPAVTAGPPPVEAVLEPPPYAPAIEAAPVAGPLAAAPIAHDEPVSLDLLEAPPEEVEVPALGLEPIQGVLPEPLLEPPAAPAPVAAADPLHPPLPEAVRANVFVPPAPLFARSARPLAEPALHPPLPEPVRADVFVPPAPIFAPPAWAIPSGPPAQEPALPSPEPVALEPIAPEPIAPEPVPASAPAAASAPLLPLEPTALPPIELSPIDLPPIELAPVEVEPPAALPAEPTPVQPEVVQPEVLQPIAAAPEPLPAPEAGFGAYDELASSGPRFALGAPPVEPLSGAWDAGGEPLLDPAIQPYQPAPPGTPLGEYDEQPAGGGRGIETMLPFDPAAAVAIPLGSIPDGYQAAPPEPEEPSISLELDLPGKPLDAPPLAPASVPPVAELSEVSADWQPEGALDQGFELASDGSFGLPELSLGETPSWPPPAPPGPPPFALDPPGRRTFTPAPAPVAAPPPSPPSPPAESLFPAQDVEEVLEVMGPGEGDETELPSLELHPAPAAAPPPVAPSPSAFVAPAAGLFAAALTPAPARPPAAAPPPASVFVPPAPGLFGRPPPAPALAPPPRQAPPIDLDLEADPPRPTAPGRGAGRPPALTPAPFVQAVPAAPAEQVPPPAAPPAAPAARPLAAAPVAPRLKPTAPPAGPHGLAAPPTLAPPSATARPAPSIPLAPAPPPAADHDPGTALESLPPLLPGTRFEGTHRVLVHTVDGEVKRGVLESPVMDGDRLTLLPQGTGAPQVLETTGVKAVFFLLAAGERPPAPEGRKVRVTFRDGRQVLGASPDYQEGQVGFLLLPVEAKTTTARIWVYQASVRQVVIG